MTYIKLTKQAFELISQALSRWIDDLGANPIELQTLRMLEDKKSDPDLKKDLKDLINSLKYLIE